MSFVLKPLKALAKSSKLQNANSREDSSPCSPEPNFLEEVYRAGNATLELDSPWGILI
jgi:hypothetical protein